jgi:signal peptide peptidase SppA
MPRNLTIPRLAELAGQAWYLSAETAEAWREILCAKLAGGKVEVTDFVAAVPGRNEDKDWEQDGALAVIPVTGSLQKRSSLFHSGMTYSKLQAMVAEALADGSVEAILLDIDSPGGSADGITGLSAFLQEAAGQKPLYAFVNGTATSAAYWIASLAQKIAAPPEGQTGSIGVRSLHVDYSRMNEERGVTVTHLAVGDYKAAGNSDEPLGDEARAYFMERLDQLYGLFVQAVAEQRGLDAQAVRDTQARIYLAQEAKELGLIDEVMSRESFINQIKGSLSMDLKELKEKHPALVKEIQAEATGDMIPQAEAEAAQAEAVAAESRRCVALVGNLMGEGLAGKLQAVLDTGASAEQAQALAGLLGQSQDQTGGDAAIMAQVLKAYQDSDQGLTPMNQGKDNATKGKLDVNAEAKRIAAEDNCSMADAYLKVAELHPAEYQAYLKDLGKEG